MKIVFFAITILVLLLLGFFLYFQLKKNQTIANLASNQPRVVFLFPSLIVAVTAVISFVIYLLLGSTDQLNLSQSNTQKLRIEFTKALGRLSKQINQDPDNVYSWYLLAEGHFKLGQLNLAKKYISKAYELDLSDLQVNYGEVLLLYAKVLGAQQGDFKDTLSFDILENAYQQLQIQFQNMESLNELQKQKINFQLVESAWLLGFAYFNNSRLDDALEVWRKLDDDNLNDNQKQIINEAINQAEIYQQNIFELAIKIEIQPQLYQQINSQAALFVTLKERQLKQNSQVSTENNSNTMPIAAKREVNLTLPKEIVLNQNDLLVTSRSKVIDRSQSFTIQAFISQDGSASLDSGDLISEIKHLNGLDGSNQKIVLLINQIHLDSTSN